MANTMAGTFGHRYSSLDKLSSSSFNTLYWPEKPHDDYGDTAFQVELNPDGLLKDNSFLPRTYTDSLVNKSRCQQDYALKWGLSQESNINYNLQNTSFSLPQPFQLQGSYASAWYLSYTKCDSKSVQSHSGIMPMNRNVKAKRVCDADVHRDDCYISSIGIKFKSKTMRIILLSYLLVVMSLMSYDKKNLYHGVLTFLIF